MLKFALIKSAQKSKGSSIGAEGGLALILIFVISILLAAIFIGLPIIFIIGAFKSMNGELSEEYLAAGLGVAFSYMVSIAYLAISMVEHFRPNEPRHQSFDPEKNREEYEEYENNLIVFKKIRLLVRLVSAVLVTILITLAFFSIKFWAGTVLSGTVLAAIGILSILMVIGSLVVMVTGVLE